MSEPTNSEENFDSSRAPIISHLIELRKRFIYCLIVFLLVFAGSYALAEPLYNFLLQPLASLFESTENRRMIYTGLHEALFTYLKLAFFSALFFSLPIILIQVWFFMAPGLYRREQRIFRNFALATPVLFVLGASLAYFVVMPMAWKFFLGFESMGGANQLAIELEARVSEYLDLVIKLILAFGLSFQVPIVLLLLAKIGVLTVDSLQKNRKYAIVATFVIAALITPPDIISQIVLGTPMILLYEGSILLIRWGDMDKEARKRKSAMQGA